jgi:ABC-2 type transport system permease protein
MLNYIRAELYRNLNRAYFWVYSGSIAALVLLLNILFRASYTANVNFIEIFQIITGMLTVPVFLIAPIIDITTAEEQKNLTLKNVISFGVPRSKIGLSKVITGVILSFMTALMILTAFLGSGALFWGIDSNSLPILKETLARILAALPLWMGAVSLGTFLAIFINNNITSAIIYAFLFTGLPGIVQLLSTFVSNKFSYFYEILITTQLKYLSKPNPGNDTIVTAVGAGIAYTLLFTVITMLYTRVKEVK